MALELKSVAKQVGGEVHIHPTDLTLAPGSFNVLLGTTISGKTTGQTRRSTRRWLARS